MIYKSISQEAIMKAAYWCLILLGSTKMKAKFLFILLCFSMQLYFINATFPLSWIQQNSGTNFNLYSVDFINDNEGWISGCQGLVLHTLNGGDTWEAQGQYHRNDKRVSILIPVIMFLRFCLFSELRRASKPLSFSMT
jgi:hypothetical protein